MKIRALRELRFKTSKGEVTVKPGQVFKPADPDKLIKAGLAVPITDYVGHPLWQQADGSCYACRSRESWQSIYGATVCLRCHPPAHERLVSKWGNA